MVVITSGCSIENTNKNETELSSEKLVSKNGCEKPFIDFESDCCLDQNENFVCDNIESEQEKLNNLYSNIEVIQVYAKDTTDYRIDKNTDEISLVVRNIPSELKYLEIESIYNGNVQKLKYSGSLSYTTSEFGISDPQGNNPSHSQMDCKVVDEGGTTYEGNKETGAKSLTVGKTTECKVIGGTSIFRLTYKPTETITNIDKFQVKLKYGKSTKSVSFNNKIKNTETSYLYP